MIIKFKKAHSLSDKVYISFGEKDENGKDIYIEFPINRNGIDDVVFGPADSQNKPLIDFLSSADSIEGTQGATPMSLSDIKIFGQNKDEIWVPNYSKQRFLAYLNEKPETVYIDFENGSNETEDWPYNKLGNKKSLKFFNIGTSDIALSSFKRIISNGSQLDIGSSMLPPARSYDSYFMNSTNIEIGAELPDETISAKKMYLNCTNLKKPISLYGNIEFADDIFKGCSSITTLPKYWGNKLKSLNGAFYGTGLKGDLSDTKLPASLESIKETFASTYITKSPIIPKLVTEMSDAYKNSTIQFLPEFEERDNSILVNLNSAFSHCTKLGSSEDYIGILPNFIQTIDFGFDSCTSLKEFYITLPSELESAVGAFQNCSSLEDSPILNDKIVDISYIYRNDAKLKCPRSDYSIIVFPKSVKNASYSFDNTGITITPDMSACVNLENIVGAFRNSFKITKVSDINIHCKIPTILDAFTPGGNYIIEDFPSIPLSVVNDDFNGAFSYNVSNYQNKTLNKNGYLQKIGNFYSNVVSLTDTFNGAKNLLDVGDISLGLNDSSHSLQALDRTFKGCTALLNAPYISVDGQYNTSMNNTFEGCTSLVNVLSIPKANSYKNTFYGCSKLHGKGIEEYADDYEGVSHKNFPIPDEFTDETITSLVNSMLYGCTDLNEVSVPYNASNPSQITGGQSLNQVSIINNTARYATSTENKGFFANFPNVKVVKELTSYRLPRTPDKSDYDGWLSEKTQLVSCGISEDAKVFKMTGTFEGCSSLVNTKIVEDIYSRVANNKLEDAIIVLPSIVEDISKSFKKCTSIKKVDTIGEKVTKATEAFYGCTSLEEIKAITSQPESQRQYSDNQSGQFFAAFDGCDKLKKIGTIGIDGKSAPDLGNAGLNSLEEIGIIYGKSIDNVFNFPDASPDESKYHIGPNESIGKDEKLRVCIAEGVESMYASFRNCTKLKTVYFQDKAMSEFIDTIPASVTNLDYTFNGSGFAVDDSNYAIVFDEKWKVPANGMTSTFENCPNVHVMPKLPDYDSDDSEPMLKRTFADCENLKVVSLNKGIRYGEPWQRDEVTIPDEILNSGTFIGSTKIERCELVPEGVLLETYSFKDCESLSTIGTLSQNWGYSASAINITSSEESTDLVTEAGKNYQQIIGINESTNDVVIRIYGNIAQLQSQIDGIRQVANVINVQYAYVDSFSPFPSAADLTVRQTTKEASYQNLSSYINSLVERGFIKTSKSLVTNSVASFISSYFSKISLYFPHLKWVEKIGATNACGILATGELLKVDMNGVLIESDNEEKTYIGPSKTLEYVGTPSYDSDIVDLKTSITTSNVSNLSHAFENDTSLKLVGSIPHTVTALQKPFNGCVSLTKIGNIESNSDDYESICEGLTSLQSIGNLGYKRGISKSLDNAFKNCEKLQSVGYIQPTFESFTGTFRGCKLLQTIGYLSYNSLLNAVGSGYGYDVGYGYGYGVYGENPYGNIIGMFAEIPDDHTITIYTDQENISEMEQFFINWAPILRDVASMRETYTRTVVEERQYSMSENFWYALIGKVHRVAHIEEVEVSYEEKAAKAREWAQNKIKIEAYIKN